MAEFQLGKTYVCGITGVIGTAITITSSITNEQVIELQPKSQDGYRVEPSVFVNIKFLLPFGEEPEEKQQYSEAAVVGLH